MNRLIGLIMLMLLTGGSIALWQLLGRHGDAPGMPMAGAVPVTVEPLQPSTVRTEAEFVGILDAQTGVMLQPEAAGRITRIYVSSGDRVSAGAPIMALSSERSQAELGAAIANISAAQFAMDNSRSQLQSLLAQRLRLEAELDLQNTEIERTRRLVTDGALPQQSLDLVERDRNVAIASLRAAEEEIEAARASVSQSESFLAQSQATANAIREDLFDRTVMAPISGIVGDIPVELGAYVEVGSTLTSITQNETLDVEIAIPNEQAPGIQTGMSVELLSFETGQLIETATVDFIAPQSDSNTQTVLIKAKVVNSSGQLQDNQRVNARIILAERSGFLIPATAITRLGGQPFIFVAVTPPTDDGAMSSATTDEPSAQADSPQGETTENDPGSIAQMRSVTLGDMQGNYFQVVDGVSEGDLVVTTGLLNLQDGVPIEPQRNEATEELSYTPQRFLACSMAIAHSMSVSESHHEVPPLASSR